MMARRTLYKPTTLRLLALLLAFLSFGIGLLLLWSAFVNGKNPGWQILIVNTFAQSFIEVIAGELGRIDL